MGERKDQFWLHIVSSSSIIAHNIRFWLLEKVAYLDSTAPSNHLYYSKSFLLRIVFHQKPKVPA
jgi:hypothetical protein